MPTDRGLAERAASRAIIADIEGRVKDELGEEGFARLLADMSRAVAAIRRAERP